MTNFYFCMKWWFNLKLIHSEFTSWFVTAGLTWLSPSCYEEISFDFLPDVSVEIPSGDINTPLYDEVEEYFQQPFEELDTYMNAGYEPEGLTNSMTRESLEERLNRIGSRVLEFSFWDSVLESSPSAGRIGFVELLRAYNSNGTLQQPDRSSGPSLTSSRFPEVS